MFLAYVLIQCGSEDKRNRAAWALIAGTTRPQTMHAAVAVELATLGTGVRTLVTGIGPFTSV